MVLIALSSAPPLPVGTPSVISRWVASPLQTTRMDHEPTTETSDWEPLLTNTSILWAPGPASPLGPVDPVGPLGPLGPVGPVGPVVTVGPAAPGWPEAPAAPLGS